MVQKFIRFQSSVNFLVPNPSPPPALLNIENSEKNPSQPQPSQDYTAHTCRGDNLPQLPGWGGAETMGARTVTAGRSVMRVLVTAGNTEGGPGVQL